jgi:hypothetical protein
MMTHQLAAELLASARNKDNGKPLENNTRLIAMGDDFAIVLHSTAVVTIHADGTYTLRAGGWRTVTTKDRLNKYSPARVYQHKHEWYLAGKVSFYDGVRVDASGNVLAIAEAA